METFTVETLTHTTHNGTAPDNGPTYPMFAGFICCFIAVLMYGSNFVPIKKFYTGDGMFFQYILVSGIFLVGIVIQLIQQSEFHAIVMLGGFIWATGNLCVVPIFKTIGMGLGMSIWGTCGLLAGWATGKFGMFGTKKDSISNPVMNYIGVGLAFGSIVLYLFVKNEVSGSTNIEIDVVAADEERSPLIRSTDTSINEQQRRSSGYRSDDVLVFNKSTNNSRHHGSVNYSINEREEDQEDQMWIETLSPFLKRVIGYSLSVASGICYGVNFIPANYVQDEGDGKRYSQNGLDYVFAHFCGIYVSGSIYFYIYCVIKRNKPKVYPKVILPGIISGIMWGSATASWFIANATLSQSVTFPIIATSPAAIASLFWGVLVFREIKGLSNILILCTAFCIMSGGAILAGLSK